MDNNNPHLNQISRIDMKFPENLPEEYYNKLTKALLNSLDCQKFSHNERQDLLSEYLPKYPKTKVEHKQDWKAYDLSKTNEVELFKKLLDELLFLTVPTEGKSTGGRIPYSLRDQVFSMCMKAYYGGGLRKTQSMLKEMKRLHYIYKVPAYKTLGNFFHNKELSKILDDLILITALPVAQIEKYALIDSTGFSLSRFEQWSEYKWGKSSGKERMWRKLHAVSLSRSNIFLSAEITKKNVGDANMSVIEKVLADKPKYFDLKYFIGDKAYNSRRIFEFAWKVGLFPFIPFKKNSSGNAKGSMVWSKMFKHFKERNEEYMEIYHRRSNVETNFHMLKKRFGDALTTKEFNANVNELKIRVLVHNICCLITEAFESDISIDFSECVKTIQPCNL